MKNNLVIEVDDREPKSINAWFKLIGGVEVKRKRLKEGDYICNGIMVERKQIDDFIYSIMDGRLDRQIEKMKNKGMRCFILVCGKIEDRSSLIHPHCILGKMASVIVKHNVSIIMVDSDYELCYLMKKIFEKSLEEKKI